ncbi:acyltransferase [Flavobacterium sp. 83]|uniref:acyltransferase n=1 Tax=Flavobacterium sp. 83 TaxID=1131812 RepID=UPI00055997CC|nr:acyltransferase family protein [Flavobacterium sp. 83]
MQLRKSTSIVWLDNLKILATISVVFLHVSSPLLYNFEGKEDLNWWIGNIYDGTVRFCVPVFIMLTGSLMLSKDYDLNDFLKIKLMRIIIPFLFWSAIYILYGLVSKFLTNGHLTFSSIFDYCLSSFIHGSAYHLWYIYMIIGIYLFIPIISKWTKNCSENEILYFLIIWVISIFISQPIISKYTPNLNLSYFSGFIGYLVLGHYMSLKKLNEYKNINQISVFMFVCGSFISIYGTYLLSSYSGHFVKDLYGYLTLNVLMSSIGIFIFFKQMKATNSKITFLSNLISKYSFGIYLVHVLVLMILNKIGMNGLFINPILGIPITTISCLTISVFIAKVLDKLSFSKYIIG